MNGRAVGVLHPQEFLSIENRGEWSAIVDGRFLGAFVQTGKVTITGERFLIFRVTASTDARIRSAPSTGAEVAGVLKKGASFAAVVRDGVIPTEKWLEIKDGSYRGKFIAAQLVNTPEAVPVPGVISPGAKGRVAYGVPFAQGTPVGTAASVEVMPAPVVAAPIAAPAPAPVPVPAQTPAPAVSASTGVSKPTPPRREFDVAPTPWSEKTDQLFEERLQSVFKKKPGQATESQVIMPIYFEARNKMLGQLQTRVQTGSPLLLDAPVLFKYLRQVIAPAWFDRPEIVVLDPERAGSSKESLARAWVPIQSFASSGITVTYSEHFLDLLVNVPAEMRSPTISSVFKFENEVDREASSEKPEFFSSYLNVNASEIFDTRSVSFADRRIPVKAQFESATNVGGFVLEAYGRYIENRIGADNTVPEFARGDVRVVRDIPSQVLRTTAGDLVYPVQGFQIFRPMGGVAATSNFSMARSKLTYPTGNYELFLQRDSKVYIWVNNQLQKVVELPAGRHSLQDFPFSSGNNELRLEIVDDVGRQETKLYNFFSSAELLRPGLSQFNYAVGQPMTELNNERVYDGSNTTISAFHRYGLREDLTIAGNLQYDKFQMVVGGEALVASPIGFFRIEPAFSQTVSGQSGMAVAASYIHNDDKGARQTARSFNLSVSHSGASFLQFGNLASSGTTKNFDVTSGYTRGINKNLSASLSGTYGSYDTTAGPTNSFSLRLGINRKWEEGLNMNVGVTHTKSTAGTEELSVALFLIWSFPEEKQVISVIHNTADRSSRLDWGYNPGEGINSANYGAAIRDNTTEQGYSAQAQMEGNRARLGLSHEMVLSKTDTVGTTPNKRDSNNVTTLLLGTSLAYAGGHLAIGRPITDSFAIVAPVKNLKGQRLDVNPQGENYIARTDFLGPAVLPELGSYNGGEVSISARHLPPEMTLPRDHYSIYPKYRSGYAFEAGTDAVVYLTAKVVGPDGKPIALAAGTATLIGQTEPPITIFTNKSGTLRSEGFKPGRYRIEIASGSFAPIEITIPESAHESFDAGTIQLKTE